jgi:osmoprotectant transport system permease protein
VLIAVVSGVLIYYLKTAPKNFAAQHDLVTGELLRLLYQHVELTLAPTAIVVAVAIPLGALLTRPGLRRVQPPFLAVANVGQAIPSFGLIVLLGVAVAYGFTPAMFALVAYSFLPVLRNTMVALNEVDPALREGGRGVGLSAGGVLWRIELPLAVPVMLAGIRTAIILNVGSATIAAATNAGGLGKLIYDGIPSLSKPLLIGGAVITALLALSFDWVAEVTERVLTPRGL